MTYWLGGETLYRVQVADEIVQRWNGVGWELTVGRDDLEEISQDTAADLAPLAFL